MAYAESVGAEMLDDSTAAVHTANGTTYLVSDVESASDAEISYGLARIAESIERSGSIGGERLG